MLEEFVDQEELTPEQRAIERARREHRFMAIVFDEDQLLDIMSGRSVLVNVPSTARAVGFWYDFPCKSFHLRLVDPSFPRVKPGDMLPKFTGILERRAV